MKSMRRAAIAFCGLLVVAGCGRVPGSAAGADFKLYEASSQPAQIAVIDSRTHAIVRTLPLGTPSPDWSDLYSISSDTLIDTDPGTGTTRHTVKLPGRYQMPPATLSGLPGGLSQNGRWLAAESFDGSGSLLPTNTHLVVVDTSYMEPLRQIDLKGLFSFDAVSNDGRRVYLIEHASPATYRVRLYNIGIGLDPNVVIDKSDGSLAMTGLRLSGIPSTDGNWLFSLYVREGASPFIHALSLDGNIAFCIELPGSGYSTDANALRWSIAMTADGTKLYAANPASGVASEVNIGLNSVPSLARSAGIYSGKAVSGLLAQDVQAKELGVNAAVVTVNGKTMVVASDLGIVWIDTSGLHSGARLLKDWTVSSLALSPDGSGLWALSDTGKIAEISMGSLHVAAAFDPGARYPLSIMRVEAG